MSDTIARIIVAEPARERVIEPVVCLTVSTDDVIPGAYFDTYRTAILDLGRVTEIPVYVRMDNFVVLPNQEPQSRCAHLWTDWTRFGDANCAHCDTHAWSPYFMSDDVFSEDSVLSMARTWENLKAQAGYFEEWARELTCIAQGTCPSCSATATRHYAGCPVLTD